MPDIVGALSGAFHSRKDLVQRLSNIDLPLKDEPQVSVGREVMNGLLDQRFNNRMGPFLPLVVRGIRDNEIEGLVLLKTL